MLRPAAAGVGSAVASAGDAVACASVASHWGLPHCGRAEWRAKSGDSSLGRLAPFRESVLCGGSGQVWRVVSGEWPC